MPVAKQSGTFRDAKGNTARTSFFVTGTDSTAQALAASSIFAAMTPLSNAHLQQRTGPNQSAPTEVIYGTNAEFPNVEDKAVFTFQSATGGIFRFQIPSPISAIFLPDGETVDPANTLVTAYVSAVIANAVTRDGVTIAFGAFGTRVRRKLHRRFNIFTKDPNLTGPGE